jgi:LytS/YehU family sensor histidine kinase
LRQANLVSQFESLKAQVNPHFLFNCLNSLSSLISQNPTKAEDLLMK